MGKGKESSSSSKRVWSDWSYDKKSRQYFRTSMDKKGKCLYDWTDNPDASATGNEDFDYDYDHPDDEGRGMATAASADSEYFVNQPRSLPPQDREDTAVDELTYGMGAHSLSRSPQGDEYTHVAQGSNYPQYDDSEAGPSTGYGAGSAWVGQHDPNDYEGRDYGDADYYQPDVYYDDGGDAGDYQPLQSDTRQNFEDPASQYYPPTEGSNQEKLLDPNFQLHYSRDFTAGSIIKIWWSEGKGQKRTADSKNSFPIGNLVHSNARRFLVVTPPADGTSWIVPISTYNDRGCTKSGSKARNHGIIYDAQKTPVMLPGEPTLGYGPVRAHMFESSETLTPSSRIDYSKLQSIQHNQPVWFLGEVDDQDFDEVVNPALDEIWYKKRGSGGGESSRRPKHSHRDSGRKDDKKHRERRRK